VRMLLTMMTTMTMMMVVVLVVVMMVGMILMRRMERQGAGGVWRIDRRQHRVRMRPAGAGSIAGRDHQGRRHGQRPGLHQRAAGWVGDARGRARGASFPCCFVGKGLACWLSSWPSARISACLAACLSDCRLNVLRGHLRTAGHALRWTETTGRNRTRNHQSATGAAAGRGHQCSGLGVRVHALMMFW
jgi:hypothetical protein